MAPKVAPAPVLRTSLTELFCYNLLIFWCPEGDLNPHVRLSTADFKSQISHFAGSCTEMHIIADIYY